MDALWSVAKPDKAKIESYHKSVVDLMAPRIVKEVLDKEYPGYAKRTASKATPTTAKKADGKPTQEVQTVAIPVSAEPAFGEIDWNRDPSRNLYVTNKAYLRKTGKLVTWGKKK
jgi:hypothetical protein